MKLRILFFAVMLVAPAISYAAEQVTVSYTDGKSDTGELVDQNPDKLVLRVTVGGNHVDMPVPWTKIQKVSNGLTQDAVITKWKTDNAAKLCRACNGDRKIVCTKCEGSGLLKR